jgi:tRNA threonylcarbamoyl adenosine modification protein YjeE
MMDFGASIARMLHEPKVIALQGDLGAGKTTLAKGMIALLTGLSPDEISSPTFQYVHLYDGRPEPVAHFDLWRLNNIDDFLEIGLEEYLKGHIAIIEWPDRLQGRRSPHIPENNGLVPSLLPSNTLTVDIIIAGHERIVTLKTTGRFEIEESQIKVVVENAKNK